MTNQTTTEPEIQVTRLRLNHFRGWDQVDVEVGPGGLVFIGKEATGKSSFIHGVRAAIEAEGIGPEVLRFDAPSGGVVLDMVKIEQARRTALQIQRTIKKKGNGKGEVALVGADGVALPRGADQIKAMFGGRPSDPMAIYKVLNDAKKLRQIIMEANPCTVTAEDLNKWCETAQEWNTEGHGHEVLERVRQMYFDQRTKAGQEAERLAAESRLKEAETIKLRVEKLEAMTPDTARTYVAAAQNELTKLHERSRLAEEREAQAEGTRTRIAELRAKAEVLMAKPEAARPPDSDIEAAYQTFQESKRAMQIAEEKYNELLRRDRGGLLIEQEASAAVATANDLEAAISQPEDGDVSELLAAAEAAAAEAEALVTRAEASARYRAAKEEATRAASASQVANDAWEKLDRIVKCLTKDAPAELAKRSDMIPGLELTPDAVYLDKRNLTVISGSERMKFAVTLAKRIAAKSKILTVDGMEAISPAEQPGFVRMCLEGGWILFATVVSDGPLQIVDAYTFSQAA